MVNFASFEIRKSKVNGNNDESHQVLHKQGFVQINTQNTYSRVIYLYAQLL